MDRGLKRLTKYLIIVSFALFIPFILGKYVLVYPDMGYDTYHSYLPTYEFIVNKIQSGSFSFMDFSYGLGSNILSFGTLICDPFSIIPILVGLIFGVTNTAFGIVYMQILKTIVAGILCYLYLSEFDYSDKSKMVASFIYGFSGYMFGAGQHYVFATIPVAFILILLFIEKTFKDKRHISQLILSIAFIGVLSAYFSLSTVIFCIFYISIRIFILNKDMTVRKFLNSILPFIFSAIVGLMIAAIIFLPTVYIIVSISSRVSDNLNLFDQIINAFKLISFPDLKMSILKLFSENIQGTVNNWSGGQYHFGSPHYFFSILFALCLPQYLINSFSKGRTKREKIINGIIIFLVVFSCINYFMGYLTNMFSIYYVRYSVILLPLFAIVIADILDNIFIKKKFNRLANIITVILGVLLVSVYYDRNTGIYSYMVAINAIGSLLILGLILDFIAMYNNNNPRIPKIAMIMLSCMVALNVFVDDAVILYARRGIVNNQELKNQYHDSNIDNIIKELNDKEGNNFYRVDKGFDFSEGSPTWVNSFINRYRSVSTYNSSLNRNSIKFVKEFGHSATPGDILQAYIAGSYGEIFDRIMSDSLGLKYIITPYQRNSAGWEQVDKLGNLFLYKNTNINSAGLIYDNYITESDFEALSPIEKKMFMADGIIVNDVVGNYNKLTSINYVDNTKAFDFSKINCSSLYINEIPRVGEIVGSSYKDGFIEVPINSQLINNQNNQNVLSFNIQSNSNFDIKVVFDVGYGFNEWQGLDSSNSIVANTTNNTIAIKVPTDAKAVRLILGQTGFHITNLALSQKEILYTNKNIDFQNPNLGNIVSGSVSMNKDGLFYIPIPYEDGWKAYVDNKEVKILQANFGFSALELSGGEHEIKFKYTTPKLLLGSIISLIGLTLFIIIYIKIRKERKNCYI